MKADKKSYFLKIRTPITKWTCDVPFIYNFLDQKPTQLGKMQQCFIKILLHTSLIINFSKKITFLSKGFLDITFHKSAWFFFPILRMRALKKCKLGIWFQKCKCKRQKKEITASLLMDECWKVCTCIIPSIPIHAQNLLSMCFFSLRPSEWLVTLKLWWHVLEKTKSIED